MTGDAEEKVALLLGKKVEGMQRDVMDIVDGWLLKELLVWCHVNCTKSK